MKKYKVRYEIKDYIEIFAEDNNDILYQIEGVIGYHINETEPKIELSEIEEIEFFECLGCGEDYDTQEEALNCCKE